MEISRSDLKKLLHCATNNIRDFVHDNDKFIDEFLSNIKDEELKDEGCPYQQEINNDYDFKCNCTDDERYQCMQDI